MRHFPANFQANFSCEHFRILLDPRSNMSFKVKPTIKLQIATKFKTFHTPLYLRKSLCTTSQPKLRILVGSQTGTAMGFAHELQHEASDHNMEADVVDMNDYDVVRE